jgi:hypothetical protein
MPKNSNSKKRPKGIQKIIKNEFYSQVFYCIFVSQSNHKYFSLKITLNEFKA